MVTVRMKKKLLLFSFNPFQKPFGISKGKDVLIVIKVCRPRCVYSGGLLIGTPLIQWGEVVVF